MICTGHTQGSVKKEACDRIEGKFRQILKKQFRFQDGREATGLRRTVWKGVKLTGMYNLEDEQEMLAAETSNILDSYFNPIGQHIVFLYRYIVDV